MENALIIANPAGGSSILARIARGRTPALFGTSEQAQRRFWEFFTVHIRNPNTRHAYLVAVWRFADWCGGHGIPLAKVEPMVVAAYVEELTGKLSAASVKQHLAAIRMLFDWLVVGQILPFNPASSVRGPKHVVKKGKTPVLSAEEARELLDEIDLSTLAGLRDRALIGVLVFSFARITAAVSMRVSDYYTQGKRSFFRLHEKGGRYNVVPAHHLAQEYVDAYLEAAEFGGGPEGATFPELPPGTAGSTGVPGDVTGDRTPDDQAAGEKGRAAGGDLRAQLPRDRDHGVSPERRRSGGGGAVSGPRVDAHDAALQPGSGRDLARRDRADSHLGIQRTH